ncbi:unnamed protein product [Mycena citricolor]|uniref:histidine kinase n=1 Tax=Mycena citricolor TaxID=2018698 RepID=A0AAD2H0N2_9AGAR|nr:unnamed protein product [Mycena citricolor]
MSHNLRSSSSATATSPARISPSSAASDARSHEGSDTGRNLTVKVTPPGSLCGSPGPEPNHGLLNSPSKELQTERSLVIQRFGLDNPSLWPLADRYARIAHALFKAPILILLIHENMQLVLAAVACKHKPRESLVYRESLCSHTALRTDGTLLDIPDTQHDRRFEHIPDLPRSFAGQPLLLPLEDGGPLVPFGSFAVLGTTVRNELSQQERESLSDLAHLLSTEVLRVFNESRHRKEALRRNFVSDLIADLSSFHSNISPPVEARDSRVPPNLEAGFRMLSATTDVRRMLDSDFTCLLDLSSFHVSWLALESPRKQVTRTVSRSKHGWIGTNQRISSLPSDGDDAKAESAGIRIIDYSCGSLCPDFAPEAVLATPRAIHVLTTFLRSYAENNSGTGYTYTGTDGPLQAILPPGSNAHIAVPLFNNAQPALLLIVATVKARQVYEPADVSFASTFAVLCLGSLAKTKLIKADAAKTAFVSMISHELRTPLHGLLSQLELIREFAPKEYQAETETFLRTAEVCGLTLRDVLNDVLDFGKQENSSDVQTQSAESDLSHLAIDVMNGDCLWPSAPVAVCHRRSRFSGGSQRRNRDFPVELECHRVQTSEAFVGRVLLNLASNALKYTPKGSITLSLRDLGPARDRQPDGHRLIKFSMKDTGIGMSEEFKKDIFTPFSQESSFNPGSGLGMSISNTILRRMGGKIAVDSELGKGTMISFTIPVEFTRPRSTDLPESPRVLTKTLISKDEADPEPTASRATPSPPETPVPTPPATPDPAVARGSKANRGTAGAAASESSQIRVLVVDDNQIGRKILTTLLTRKGIPFREASDGSQALEVYKEFLPHLVWTDVSMPGMNGIESARRMRIVEHERGLRPAHIVALTGMSSSGEMKEGLLGDAALDEWLVKGQASLKTLTGSLESVQRSLRRRWRPPASPMP